MSEDAALDHENGYNTPRSPMQFNATRRSGLNLPPMPIQVGTVQSQPEQPPGANAAFDMHGNRSQTIVTPVTKTAPIGSQPNGAIYASHFFPLPSLSNYANAVRSG